MWKTSVRRREGQCSVGRIRDTKAHARHAKTSTLLLTVNHRGLHFTSVDDGEKIAGVFWSEASCYPAVANRRLSANTENNLCQHFSWESCGLANGGVLSQKQKWKWQNFIVALQSV